MHAVPRIAYHGLIDNIQASWVKLGARRRPQVLQAGVNDLGGTLMDENISRAAGADHGQMHGRPTTSGPSSSRSVAPSSSAPPSTAGWPSPDVSPRRARVPHRQRGPRRAHHRAGRGGRRPRRRGPGLRDARLRAPHGARSRSTGATSSSSTPHSRSSGTPSSSSSPTGGCARCRSSARPAPRSTTPATSPPGTSGGRWPTREWMIITGAGPGIMEAGIEGAGAGSAFGVNIVLPFEQEATPLLAGDPKLVNYRYFFTRKLSFMKESSAFAMLPGRLRHPRRDLRAAHPHPDRAAARSCPSCCSSPRARPTGRAGCASPRPSWPAVR